MCSILEKIMIIGREKEKKLLEKAYRSNEAEFIAIYGRRRIGKTYLIREFFGHKKCHFFHTTGLQNGDLKTQLKKFTEALSQTFFDNIPLKTPANWGDAFSLLHSQIAKNEGKVVIFLDELPWLATRKSGLLQELDYYWNRHWSAMKQVILIVCDSSASWLIKKIIYSKGGLYNRTTAQIRLLPFSLAETNKYLKSRKVKLNHRHVLTLYLALGGVPYYLRYVDAGLSAEQNIQQLIFDNDAPLQDEYAKLFDSLFDKADTYKSLVTRIAQKREGVSRAELSATDGGGRLSQRLQDLSSTGFIEEYIPWGQTKGEYYKVTDEFCLFHVHWVAPHKGKKFAQNYWVNQSQRPTYYAWAGYAFEAVCMKHVENIINALGIRANSTIGSWRSIPKKGSAENGAQIDLVIERTDNAITLCEIKYTDKPYAIDKHYAEKLKHTMAIFGQKTKTTKQLFLAIISANGLKKTIYSEGLVSGIVTLNDLFA